MSVQKPLRGENKLEAHVKVEELIVHTLQITSNESVFDPKYQSLIDRIVDCVISIGQDMWEANGIYVNNDPERWTVRRGLQDRACRHFDNLLYLMTVSRRAFHLRKRKYENWVNMTQEAKTVARAWRDSDKKRYGHLK